MKIKLDENLPTALAVSLRDLGHDVETVAEEGLSGSDDPVIWQAAQSETRFLITQDLDFSDARLYKPGTHYGLLIVRLRDPSHNQVPREFYKAPSDLEEDPHRTSHLRPGSAPFVS